MSWVLTLAGDSNRNPKLAPWVCIIVGFRICHSNRLVTRVMDGKDVAVVQSLSHVWLFVIPWTASCQASLFFTISWILIKLMSIESVMLSYLEKAMTPHSSTLAWRIPGTGEPGGLPSMGSHRVGHDWSDLAAAAAAAAILLSYPLLPPSPPALNLSQHQNIFQWVSCSHQVAKVLELQLRYQSFQWVFRGGFLYDWLQSSPAPQFKSISFSVLSLLYGPTVTSIHDYWKNQSFDYMDLCWQSDVSAFYSLNKNMIHTINLLSGKAKQYWHNIN